MHERITYHFDRNRIKTFPLGERVDRQLEPESICNTFLFDVVTKQI